LIELIVIFVMEYTGRWERGVLAKRGGVMMIVFAIEGVIVRPKVGNIVRTREAGVLFIDAHSIT
jgi:hypothetical protein